MHEYKFKSAQDRNNYEAALTGKLTSRLLIITSEAVNTGKTTMALEIARAMGDTDDSVGPLPPTDMEFSRLIFDMKQSGRKTIVFDNCKREIRGGTVENYMLCENTVFRKLGSNEFESYKNDMLMIVTGSNIRVSDDIARRNPAFIHLTSVEEN